MKYRILGRNCGGKTNETSLKGYVEVGYDKLVELFGQPSPYDGYKTDGAWILEFSDGLIATIYNWKNGRNYLGDRGKDIEDIFEWHIGGHKNQVVQRIKDICKGGKHNV